MKVRATVRSKKRTYLDDIGNEGDDIAELAHVDVEVSELIAQGLLGHDGAAFPDGGQASEIADGVQLGVWRFGEIGPGHVASWGERGKRGSGPAGGADARRPV